MAADKLPKDGLHNPWNCRQNPVSHWFLKLGISWFEVMQRFPKYLGDISRKCKAIHLPSSLLIISTLWSLLLAAGCWINHVIWVFIIWPKEICCLKIRYWFLPCISNCIFFICIALAGLYWWDLLLWRNQYSIGDNSWLFGSSMPVVLECFYPYFSAMSAFLYLSTRRYLNWVCSIDWQW